MTDLQRCVYLSLAAVAYLTMPTAAFVPEACRTYQLTPMNNIPEPKVAIVSEKK